MRCARPRLVAFGLLILLVGLAMESSEDSTLEEDLGVLVIVGALAVVAAFLPSVRIGPQER